ncbi:hypothetical protein [Parvibaculum sp.]|uniref:hypothetical protein n=1 Tax=Parvibaculum sp. TaxID=2024848 RepID=UPI0025E1E084|nr:hypothetical protein [Parvibaculum sp.]
MEEAFTEACGLNPWPGVPHITASAVAAMAAFRVLLRQVPFVPQLPVPAVVETRAALGDLSQHIRVEASDALDLPMREEDGWLISEMLYNVIPEAAFPGSERRKTRRTHEGAGAFDLSYGGRSRPEGRLSLRAPARPSP